MCSGRFYKAIVLLVTKRNMKQYIPVRSKNINVFQMVSKQKTQMQIAEDVRKEDEIT